MIYPTHRYKIYTRHGAQNIPDTQEVLNILDILIQALIGETHIHISFAQGTQIKLRAAQEADWQATSVLAPTSL